MNISHPITPPKSKTLMPTASSMTPLVAYHSTICTDGLLAYVVGLLSFPFKPYHQDFCLWTFVALRNVYEMIELTLLLRDKQELAFDTHIPQHYEAPLAKGSGAQLVCARFIAFMVVEQYSIP